jgi:hypothetical protein
MALSDPDPTLTSNKAVDVYPGVANPTVSSTYGEPPVGGSADAAGTGACRLPANDLRPCAVALTLPADASWTNSTTAAAGIPDRSEESAEPKGYVASATSTVQDTAGAALQAGKEFVYGKDQ